MLNGKNIVIGISGGIAVYKMCEVVSKLVKLGANVDVVMTKNATEFVAPLTFETLSHNSVSVDMFGVKQWRVEHVALAKKADLFVVAPATANVIAKMANGIADDMLSTTILAVGQTTPVLVAPAMNSAMYLNRATQRNLDILRSDGKIVLEPQSGMLACGDSGIGRLPEPSEIVCEIERILAKSNDYANKCVLVTAGGTSEKLDDVRVITNFSSGKMGCAIAQEAAMRGAKVALVLGKHTCAVPQSPNINVINVDSTQQMFDQVMSRVSTSDVIIKAAAPCDFRPETKSDTKIKVKELTVKFVPNPDIAQAVGQVKGYKLLVVFSAETDHLIENAKAKMIKKNADLCVANDITAEGCGFDVDTNKVSFIDRQGNVTDLPLMSKREVAVKLLDKILTL